MPFLAVVLLLLLHSDRVPVEDQNRWLSNSALAVSGLLFVALIVIRVLNLLP